MAARRASKWRDAWPLPSLRVERSPGACGRSATRVDPVAPASPTHRSPSTRCARESARAQTSPGRCAAKRTSGRFIYETQGLLAALGHHRGGDGSEKSASTGVIGWCFGGVITSFRCRSSRAACASDRLDRPVVLPQRRRAARSSTREGALRMTTTARPAVEKSPAEAPLQPASTNAAP